MRLDAQWGDEAGALSQEARMQAAFHKLLRRQLLVSQCIQIQRYT